MTDSVHIFERYVSGDGVAADDLFYRYMDRLTRLARSRLSQNLARRVDAEDIVMSAYRSFFIGARDGRFSIEQGGELWSLLVRITLHKLYRTAAHHTAQKRAMDRDVVLFDVTEANPSPTDAIALADEVEVVMRNLPAERRRILELRLQGELIDDIANEVGINERTVRRALKEIQASLAAGVDFPTGWQHAAPSKRKPPQRKHTAIPTATLRYSDYVLEQQVGAGGMGRVYRATRKADGATVAIKYLKKTFLAREDAVHRFIEEAGTVAALHHQNIVGVHGFGQTAAGGLFIAMDFVSGTDLSAFCSQPEAETTITDWMLQLCSALVHSHSERVIHCDLKPDNVLLREDGMVLLTDFGLSRKLDDQADASEFAGTAPYMAPEQIDSTLGPVDERTDVYGLGALLFHLCTGQPPFTGQRVGDVLAKVVTQSEPLLPSKYGGNAQFDPICRRCLCAQDDRFSGMAEMANAIREAIGHQ
ncbi:MAG: protein kinase [Planctomycetaceae bacterium]